MKTLQIEELVKELPEDFYGVHIENERDVSSLAYLVNEVGEKKLLSSIGVLWKNPYKETQDVVLVSNLAKNIFWLVLPYCFSLPFRYY